MSRELPRPTLLKHCDLRTKEPLPAIGGSSPATSSTQPSPTTTHSSSAGISPGTAAPGDLPASPRRATQVDPLVTSSSSARGGLHAAGQHPASTIASPAPLGGSGTESHQYAAYGEAGDIAPTVDLSPESGQSISGNLALARRRRKQEASGAGASSFNAHGSLSPGGSALASPSHGRPSAALYDLLDPDADGTVLSGVPPELADQHVTPHALQDAVDGVGQ